MGKTITTPKERVWGEVPASLHEEKAEGLGCSFLLDGVREIVSRRNLQPATEIPNVRLEVTKKWMYRF